MTRICFVCLGNICRSPMAEFIMKEKLRQKNLIDKYLIDSKATSYEEYGNPIDRRAENKLLEKNIPITPHRSNRLQKDDYEKYDYFIGMDESNIRNMNHILGNDPENKIYKLTDFTKQKKDIEDPWYTNKFEEAYQDILLGVTNLIKYLEHEK